MPGIRLTNGIHWNQPKYRAGNRPAFQVTALRPKDVSPSLDLACDWTALPELRLPRPEPAAILIGVVADI
jgi:hypothetical protein